MSSSNHDENAKKYYESYYGSLTGAVIDSVNIVMEDDYGRSQFWPTFNVTLKDGFKVVLEIAQDPEGNGPGFIFGLPSVEVKV